MVPTLDVCSVADFCVDLVLSGDVVPRFRQMEQLVDDYALDLGGSAVIFATQFTKLGGRSALIGTLGDDPFGDFIEERLRATGIDASRVRRRGDIRTGLTVSLAKPDGDRAMLTLLGTINATTPDDLPTRLLRRLRHWHVASYFLLEALQAHWPRWLRRCGQSGVTVSLDTNWDPRGNWGGVRELLPFVDVFLPNEAEAKAVCGVSDVDVAGRALADMGPLVVVKRGESGATAYGLGRTWSAPALPVAQVLDTVGAGDNFDAGFLRAWLLGMDPVECLQLGNRCAASSLGAGGGIAGQLVENVERGTHL
jgi:sugar/nucleoside kinase (ribokinase family)